MNLENQHQKRFNGVEFDYAFRCIVFRVIQVYHGWAAFFVAQLRNVCLSFLVFAFQSNCFSRVITVDGQKKIIIFASRRYLKISFLLLQFVQVSPFLARLLAVFFC